jgi:hypothetical protein
MRATLTGGPLDQVTVDIAPRQTVLRLNGAHGRYVHDPITGDWYFERDTEQHAVRDRARA